MWFLESGIAQTDVKYHFFGIQDAFYEITCIEDKGNGKGHNDDKFSPFVLKTKQDFSHVLIIAHRQISILHDHDVRLIYGMVILAPLLFLLFFSFFFFKH